jgi:hypothetical protein
MLGYRAAEARPTPHDSELRSLYPSAGMHPSSYSLRFELDEDSKGAQLPAVELSEKTLTQIGYFVDEDRGLK